jgi:hypothetical protein
MEASVLLTCSILPKTGSNGKNKLPWIWHKTDNLLRSTGANLNWPEEFGVHVGPEDHNPHDRWIFALYDGLPELEVFEADIVVLTL